MRLLCLAAGATAAAMALGSGAARAQDPYPAKVIRIVTAAAGSNNDWGARLVGQELTARMGQQVIVENRGSIGVEVVAKSPPDGYTLLFYGSIAWLQPYLTKVTWDPLRDLAPITLSMTSPNIVTVHPSLPVNSIKELIALAKKRPGDLNYGAGGAGASPHLAAELFKYMAGVHMVRVNYKGTGPAMIALLGGEVHLMFPGLGSVAPYLKQGKLRPLAVTTPARSRLAPELPTVAEFLPGYASESVIGFFAPAKTPAAIVGKLNFEINRAMKTTDPERLYNLGVEAAGTTPEEFGEFIKSEMTRMGKVIKSAGFSN